MFTTDVLNEVILKNHSITLSDIIILPVAISTALTVGEVKTKFSF